MQNRKFLIAVCLLVFVILSASFLFMEINGAYANAVPEFNDATPHEIYVLTSTPDSTEENQATEEKASTIAKGLVDSWNENNLSKQGWIHLVYQITSDVSNGIVLPDDNQMANSYIEDSWFYVDNDGLIKKDVVTLKDLRDNTLQQSAFLDNIGINFTFGIRDENYLPYQLKVDRGIVQFLIDAESLGVVTSSRKIQDVNNPLVEFYYTEVYSQPVQLHGIEQPVESVYVSAVFHEETGEMLVYTKIMKTIDGAEILFEKTELVLFELLTEVPSEILSILENVK
ncbi:MAG TPA: hypothetical protein VNJ29_04055 [Candidatus Nitrosotenuis sp.]|nr:hypothetical protein [Candidatus Nitrosotenuis sp.]